MRPIQLFVCLAFAVAAADSAAEPSVVFGNGEARFRMNTPFKVASRVLQLQLDEHNVISAHRGAEFTVATVGVPSAGFIVEVHSHTVQLINTQSDLVSKLSRGRFLLAISEANDAPVDLLDLTAAQATDLLYPAHMRDIEPIQGVRLADWAMYKQTDYLRELSIDTRKFLRAIFFLGR